MPWSATFAKQANSSAPKSLDRNAPFLHPLIYRLDDRGAQS
jgi:hypothetical protein